MLLKRTRCAAHTGSWEKVVAVFVEGHGHDAVSQVKGLLYTVTMMNVDVNVENSGVVSENDTPLETSTHYQKPRLCLSYFSSSSMLMTMSFT